MSKRKSIVSSFGDFTNTAKGNDKQTDETAMAESSEPSVKSRVGAGIIGATKRSLTELREERDQLLASVMDGASVITLDAKLIDPSPFKDRLPDDNAEDFEAFKKTLIEEGQKVPITVRCNPHVKTRYQTVYGHRRARALKELGLPVEAILRDYSDRDLVVAQGIENANRQDLSWIERALFAATMSDQGLKPKDIKAALHVDDAQLSKFRSVYNVLGRDVIELIGRAPMIGRPRWIELVGLLNSKGDHEAMRKTLSDDKVSAFSSDDRFMAVLTAVSRHQESRETKARTTRTIGDIGKAVFGADGVRFVIEKRYASKFHEFLEGQLDNLVSDFKRTLDGERL